MGFITNGLLSPDLFLRREAKSGENFISRELTRLSVVLPARVRKLTGELRIPQQRRLTSSAGNFPCNPDRT